MAGLFFIYVLVPVMASAQLYGVIREYSGTTFFDRWDFYGNVDNTTFGNVTWLSKTDAISKGLAYVYDGHVIIKVDNATYVNYGEARDSVRITTQDAYDLGSLWILDAAQIPYGCSVWPAFWSFGPQWPQDGEIDIIEGINLMPSNQMAIHTTPGCTHNGSMGALGTPGTSIDCSQPSGCTVLETSPNSFQGGFVSAGGGVLATLFDSTGILIWFWSRSDMPSTIKQATSTSQLDISGWGAPHASFLSTTCNISQFFSPQNLVLDITLCGDWAGVSEFYSPTCGNSGPTGLCYNDCVVGPGSPRYDNAFWNISYIRTYTTTTAIAQATSAPPLATIVESPATLTSTTPTSTAAAFSMIIPPALQPISSARPLNNLAMSCKMIFVCCMTVVISGRLLML